MEWRMDKLVWSERKATAAQITTLYNCGEQKDISHWSLKYSRWATTAEHYIRFYFSQQRTESWRWYKGILVFLLFLRHTVGRVRVWTWINEPNLPCVNRQGCFATFWTVNPNQSLLYWHCVFFFLLLLIMCITLWQHDMATASPNSFQHNN